MGYIFMCYYFFGLGLDFVLYVCFFFVYCSATVDRLKNGRLGQVTQVRYRRLRWISTLKMPVESTAEFKVHKRKSVKVSQASRAVKSLVIADTFLHPS